MLVGLPLYHLRPRALGTTPGPGICASFQNGNTGWRAIDRGTVGSSSDEARTRGIGDEKAAPTLLAGVLASLHKAESNCFRSRGFCFRVHLSSTIYTFPRLPRQFTILPSSSSHSRTLKHTENARPLPARTSRRHLHCPHHRTCGADQRIIGVTQTRRSGRRHFHAQPDGRAGIHVSTTSVMTPGRDV
jgi:hypothetical protein